jgi:nicotinamidase/pyrazinamidase
MIDIQNDFVPGGALAAKGGEEIIPLINQIQKKFDLIVATQDWHPPDHVSFAQVHGKKTGDVIVSNGVQQVLWPVHCVKDTWGAELISSLDTSRINKIFYKGTQKNVDSYSAIYDNKKLRSTGLEEYLKESQIKEIYISGLVTDYCIKYTALDCSALGYPTYVIIDACRGANLNPNDTNDAVEEMEAAGVKIIHSYEL